ncbi:hypothetical protein SEA_BRUTONGASTER_169 [Gordonia phage BrutonGaster]|uniref:Uncharacterized protein n=1 Tax=Gordonia phage BrutonGaster TaxID=2530116 RepID=A0A482JKR2_9CAUD|nr:hypothetical protein HOV26_gp013 [Gordonia phage BrutonGaster]QBP33383.1 hypothetical protein SEA_BRUTONGASTER_169 [Gordonia phage BrutonGaster]
MSVVRVHTRHDASSTPVLPATYGTKGRPVEYTYMASDGTTVGITATDDRDAIRQANRWSPSGQGVGAFDELWREHDDVNILPTFRW